MTFTEILGYSATIVVALAYLPQTIKVYKTKDVRGLSTRWLIAMVIGLMMWTVYSISMRDIPFTIANVTSLGQLTYFLTLKFRNV